MRKPSERRHAREPKLDLDLTPMMNLIGILIPSLLVSMVFVETAVVDVSTPGHAPGPSTTPPLQLTVRITDTGYEVVAREGDDEQRAPIPLREREVDCRDYAGTRPPPRRANSARPPCASDTAHPYVTYDTEALRTALLALKQRHADERTMVIDADGEVEFESLVQLMDAARSYDDEAGREHPLFDIVSLRAGSL